MSLLLLLVLALPARALNQRLYPLKEIVRDSECIAVGRVVAVDRGRMRAALVIEEPLKGTSAYRWIALNVAPGGWGHPTALLRRLAPGVRLLFFAARAKGRHVLLAYTNGTWFQMTAPDGPETERLPWTFTRCETYLRRTYAGTTAELETLLRDVTTGKREAPAPNPTTGPGMGPEVPASFKPDATLPALPDFVAKAIAEPRAGGPERKFDVRPLTAEEQRWVDERAKLFGRKADELALLLAQARYVQRDAQRALEYERDHGQGGNRAWVRSAEEILDLKQRSDRLSWLDVRGVLLRAGELFTPVNDPVELLHGLRTRFTWDELDPLLDDEKWGRKKLADEIEKRQAARSPHPLGPGDHARGVLYQLDFGQPNTGDVPMESAGWKPLLGDSGSFARRQSAWDGKDSGAQRPGALRLRSPGSLRPSLMNQPPPPGLPLASGAGTYSGAALWFGAGTGDYDGKPRGPVCRAFYDREWLKVKAGESRSFLFVAQVYVPDHTDEVGEPRAGWFYMRRPSRYVDLGVRVVDAATRTVSQTPEAALFLPVEPALDRFDRILLRVDVRARRTDSAGRSEPGELKVIAYLDGIGEVARATVELKPPRRPAATDLDDGSIALAPALGIRTAADGYVPEVYLASLRAQQINDDPIEVLRPEGGPPPPAPSPVDGTPSPRPFRSPRSVVIAVDTSSSMTSVLDRARAAAAEVLVALKPGERFAILDCAGDVRDYAPGWTTVTAESVKAAVMWVQRLQARAGTNTSVMLERAFAYRGLNYLAVVTDGGAPTLGLTDQNQLVRRARELNAPDARVDALLVGDAPADNPAARIARENGGAVVHR